MKRTFGVIILLMFCITGTLLFQGFADREIQKRDKTYLYYLPESKYFKKANLCIFNSKRYYAVLGVSKNGLLKVFDKNKKQIIYDDYGYIAESEKGVIFSSQYFNPNVQVELEKNSIIIKGFLSKTSFPFRVKRSLMASAIIARSALNKPLRTPTATLLE